MSSPTRTMSRTTIEPSRIVTKPRSVGAQRRARHAPGGRTLGALFAALIALTACTVDERTIAPSETGDDMSVPPGGAGGSMSPVTPSMPPAMPVDTGDDTEGNPDPGMLAGGGSGNVGPSAPTPGEPAPDETPPDETPPTTEPIAPIIVNGRVIDFYRRPMPNVAVTIGGTTVMTNVQGQFSIGGVQAPYDATMTISWIRSEQRAHAGYVYQGLTRVDPTLQALEGLTERATDVTLFVNAIGFGPDQDLIHSFGGPDAFSLSSVSDADRIFTARWSGSATFGGTLRMLLVTRGAGGGADDPIVDYVGQQVSTFGFSDGVDTNMTLSVGGPAVPVANVSGSVDVPAPFDRENVVGLRFADGNRMPLFAEGDPAEGFSYLVPNIQGATLSIVAVNNRFRFPYVAAHRQNIAPGQANVSIAVPNAVTPTSPLQASTITRDTPFVWSSSGQTATTFVWRLEFANTNEYMFVVTNRTSVTLPTFADGFALGPGVPAFWSVETHGNVVDVDAAAGPAGYMDAMTQRFDDQPLGPNNADGFFTESERRDFTLSN